MTTMMGLRLLFANLVGNSCKLRILPSLGRKKLVNCQQSLSMSFQQSCLRFSALSHPNTINMKSSSEETVMACQTTYISNHIQKFHSSSFDCKSNVTFVPSEITEFEYEALSDATLNSLSDFFDELPEVFSCRDEYESEFSSGVLTIHFSAEDGTYVINKQTPNKQIWLSSPKSGPKRYDFCDGKWIYSRDGIGIHHLLEEEISEILGSKISMKECKHYS